jgi:hypothetical protein
MRQRLWALAVLAAAATALVATGVTPAAHRTASTTTASGCQLKSARGNIKHVIYIQFDNTHFRRDNPNVPSDLEQMPNLLNFIRGTGTLLTNDHTVLISHTATGILSSLTGVYPDRMGQPVSNSFRYYKPDGTTSLGVSFAYWTDPLYDPTLSPTATPTDTTPEMVNENGKIAPAPWVPYTRAGCDVGAIATANTVLENTNTNATGDITKVYGPGSPEFDEASASNAEAAKPPATRDQKLANRAQTDFVGIAVHCAQQSAVCASSEHARADLLPDEPGGYRDFNGIFGAKYVDPLITSPAERVTDANGSVGITDLFGDPVTDPTDTPGFPGFDGMLANVSLAYVADMQEHGIPVTYAYISDAHDGHGKAGNQHVAFGPGEDGYIRQLRDYDRAFGTFFADLAAHGIDKSNTLFVFTVDEGDHFVGDAPTPAGCDGVTQPCTYNRVGEINADLRRMIRTQFGDTTAFTVHSDDAPTVYINGNPAQTDTTTRQLERETAQLSWLNPYTNQVENGIMVALADRTEMKTLHMVTADPLRTPTFTPFADPDWFFFATGGPACATPDACAFIPPRSTQSFAWNHGDIQDEIASTWVGMVGPGVKNAGDYDGWTDHTDVRPTMLTLLGLKDDYETDGRAVLKPLYDWAVPQTLIAHRETLLRLGDVYKQLTAPFGTFAMQTLRASTTALASGSSTDDSKYTAIESRIADLTSQRDALAAQIRSAFNAAEVGARPLNEQQAKAWIDQAQSLIDAATALASS